MKWTWVCERGEPRITARFWYEQQKDRAASNQDKETKGGAV